MNGEKSTRIWMLPLEMVFSLCLIRAALFEIAETFQVCVAHSDFARASSFAALAVKTKAMCQGDDADGLEEIKPFIATKSSSCGIIIEMEVKG